LLVVNLRGQKQNATNTKVDIAIAVHQQKSTTIKLSLTDNFQTTANDKNYKPGKSVVCINFEELQD